MAGVNLVNATGHDIILQEGSGGIYRPLTTIRRGKVYFLKVDSTDTYREYLCNLNYQISQKGEAVTLTSDDFAEYEQVTIMWDQEGDRLSYEAKKRESGSSAAAAGETSGQASPSFFRRVLNKLSWKKGQIPTGGGGGGGGGGGSGGGAADSRGNALIAV